MTCDPPVMNTDRDVLILTSNVLDFGTVCARRIGWQTSGSLMEIEAHDRNCLSVRNGELNLIVTDDPKFYDRFMAAHSVAKRLNLMSKEDRVALFQTVLYGKAA